MYFPYIIASFSSVAAVSPQGWHENRCFLSVLAWGFMFVLWTVFVFITEIENWQCFSRLLSTFHHALITCCNTLLEESLSERTWLCSQGSAVMYPERISRAERYILILFKAMGPRINQCSPCFLEWKSKNITIFYFPILISNAIFLYLRCNFKPYPVILQGG